MNGCRLDDEFDPNSASQSINRWMLARLAAVAGEVEDHLARYQFNLAARQLYQFVWHIFCDWYVEFAKPFLSDDAQAAKIETQKPRAMRWRRFCVCSIRSCRLSPKRCGR